MKSFKFFPIVLMTITGMVFAQQNPAGNASGNQAQQQPSATAAQDQNQASDAKTQKEELWVNPDYKSYVKSLDSLVKLGDGYAQNQFRLALTNFQTGKSIIMKMRENVQKYREEAETSRHMDEKWYWQTLDRKMSEERVISEKKARAKMKAVNYFTRAIKHLDEIENKKMLESMDYKDLTANIYREWIIAQYDLGNLPQTIDILKRYLALDPKFEQEIGPHKYLASAYGFQEKILTKYGSGTEQDLIYFKKKKNEHLLRATELMYQKGSPEYEKIMEVINEDEIIAISPP